jgi:hypothetical protein
MWVRFPPGALEEFQVPSSKFQVEDRGPANLELRTWNLELTLGSFFQRPGYQVVNLAMRVQFPYEPLKRDDPFV